jgi:hypothetical protein
MEKSSAKICATTVIFKTLPKVNNHQLDKNSPNLVTLVAWQTMGDSGFIFMDSVTTCDQDGFVAEGNLKIFIIFHISMGLKTMELTLGSRYIYIASYRQLAQCIYEQKNFLPLRNNTSPIL